MLTRRVWLLLCPGLTLAASAPVFPVLTYSTYLRQNFTPKAIATDPSGNIYMAGTAVVNGTAPFTTALVVKLNPQASQYLYVRYLSGSVADYAAALAVDGSGNAYVTGYTESPDFPVTSGVAPGTPAAGQASPRSFVVKLDPNGEIVFSDLLGGSAASYGEAVAVTPSGQILVSGTVPASANAPQFPGTPGAYKTPHTIGAYLMELDPAGARIVFSALGIGGSAIALDSSGNIFVAGSTTQLDYPTTPGAYQTIFPRVLDCASPDCAFPFPGSNQYVTKIDPTGSTLIYSTVVTGTFNTGNGGLAVDPSGNVYLTGFAGAGYPYTVPVPVLAVEQAPAYQTLPFLTKLDPAGQTLLFSVPVGGAGVQLDSNGAVYVAGFVGLTSSVVGIPAGIPALANVPNQCLPSSSPYAGSHASAYVAGTDASGNLLGSKFIGGSTLTLSSAALTGSTLWIAGSASLPDFPFTPNAFTLANFGPATPQGAYLGAVDFSRPQPPSGTPQIGCIVDAADLAMAGPVARNQLLTIFGTGLAGAGIGFTASGGSPAGAVALNAPVLYSSSTQVNLAVPLLDFSESFAAMQLTVNGMPAAPVQLPLDLDNPSLFNVVLNADGSRNSSSNAAPLGSTVSMFVNGLSGLEPMFPQNNNIPAQLYASGGWIVTNIVPASTYVLRVDLQAPSTLPPNVVYCAPGPSPCGASMQVSLYYLDPAAGGATNVNAQAAEEPVFVVVP